MHRDYRTTIDDVPYRLELDTATGATVLAPDVGPTASPSTPPVELAGIPELDDELDDAPYHPDECGCGAGCVRSTGPNSAPRKRPARRRAAAKKKPNGFVLYDGPSALDGERIVVVVTGFTRRSKNGKTGRMLQT